MTAREPVRISHWRATHSIVSSDARRHPACASHFSEFTDTLIGNRSAQPSAVYSQEVLTVVLVHKYTAMISDFS